MDFMTPPMFDILNIKLRKLRCSCTSKPQVFMFFFATAKDSYFLNDKHLKTNAKVIHALKSTLNDNYLCRVANLDSAFVVWNTIVSLGEQEQYYAGSDSDVESEASNIYYMVQGDNPVEVNSESELDEDVDMSYDELALFYQTTS